jgi:hypothetical protein
LKCGTPASIVWHLFINKFKNKFYYFVDRSVAIEMGQALIDKHFGHNVKSVETFQDANVFLNLFINRYQIIKLLN